jgi:hypothetical protein
MPEMAATGEDHGHASFIRSFDHFFITHTAAGLDCGGDFNFDRFFHSRRKE